jgi:hypothetical protein
VHDRLAEICALLERAANGGLRLAVCPAGPATTPLADGWALGPTEGRGDRQAAADLVARLYRAEEENETLCSEILARYEEATIVYRLSQRLATLGAETSIAGLVLTEAASALGARAAELWLRDDEGTTRLAASWPAQADPRADLREPGPLVALQDGRAWLRAAGDGAESIVAVPLPGPESIALGVLVLRGRTGQDSYGAPELRVLGTLVCLAAAFIRVDRPGVGRARSDA